jgi:transposase
MKSAREASVGVVWSDDGWRLPDWLWERIGSLLPARPLRPLGCHDPRVADRDAMDGILLVLRTGMRWNALNATGICSSSSSARRRFREWEQAGVFHGIWGQGLLDYDEQVGIDWAWLSCDGATGKAPLGGEATGPNPTEREREYRHAGAEREGGVGVAQVVEVP